MCFTIAAALQHRFVVSLPEMTSLAADVSKELKQVLDMLAPADEYRAYWQHLKQLEKQKTPLAHVCIRRFQ